MQELGGKCQVLCYGCSYASFHQEIKLAKKLTASRSPEVFSEQGSVEVSLLMGSLCLPYESTAQKLAQLPRTNCKHVHSSIQTSFPIFHLLAPYQANLCRVKAYFLPVVRTDILGNIYLSLILWPRWFLCSSFSVF